MNKIAKMVLAAAALVAAAGCMDKNKGTTEAPPVATNTPATVPPYNPGPTVPMSNDNNKDVTPPMGGEVKPTHPPRTHLTPPAGESTSKTKIVDAGTTSTKGGKTYVVKSGDSLSKIAAHFYGKSTKKRVDAIKKANGMKTDVVRIGQKLKIPAA